MPKNPSMVSAYTIFCGVILHESGTVPDNNRLIPWTNRLDRPEIFKQYLEKSYDRNFLNNIQPDKPKADHGHFTLGKPLETTSLSFALPGGQAEAEIPYFDVFLFPDDVAIFSFKAELKPDYSSYVVISALINHLRQPSGAIEINGKSTTVREFISRSLDGAIQLRKDWDIFIPQLKTYTVINDPSRSTFSEELDRTLYELSHVLPMGASSESEFMPTSSYFSQIMGQAIAVYNNWKAIVLFDTFTRISCSYPDQYKTWEQEYFLIYVHSLYVKFRLYSFNNLLSSLDASSPKRQGIRTQFVNFVQHYQLAYISYKFLPNLIFDKTNQSLELRRELDQMEEKLERFHLTYTERKSRQLNRLLLLISVLSVISVVTDLSSLLVQMGVQSGMVYSPLSSLVLGVATLVSIYWVYRQRDS